QDGRLGRGAGGQPVASAADLDDEALPVVDPGIDPGLLAGDRPLQVLAGQPHPALGGLGQRLPQRFQGFGVGQGGRLGGGQRLGAHGPQGQVGQVGGDGGQIVVGRHGGGGGGHGLLLGLG